jgi:hypothetical protein
MGYLLVPASAKKNPVELAVGAAHKVAKTRHFFVC